MEPGCRWRTRPPGHEEEGERGRCSRNEKHDKPVARTLDVRAAGLFFGIVSSCPFSPWEKVAEGRMRGMVSID